MLHQVYSVYMSLRCSVISGLLPTFVMNDTYPQISFLPSGNRKGFRKSYFTLNSSKVFVSNLSPPLYVLVKRVFFLVRNLVRVNPSFSCKNRSNLCTHVIKSELSIRSIRLISVSFGGTLSGYILGVHKVIKSLELCTHSRDPVPKNWNRDKPRSTKKQHSNGTRNTLQIIVRTGGGRSTIIVGGGGGSALFVFVSEVCNGSQGTPCFNGGQLLVTRPRYL